MKVIACDQLGCDCDLAISADTGSELLEEMWNHLKEKHPLVCSEIQRRGVEWWCSAVMKEWDATPEASSPLAYPEDQLDDQPNQIC